MSEIHQALDTKIINEALEVARWVCDAFDSYMIQDEGPDAVDDAQFELLNRFINGGESAMAHTLAAAARAHADFLDGFPTDEDVRVATESIGDIDPRGVRLALQAVADTRRTEEER